MTVAKNKRGGSGCPEWWVRMIGTVGQLAAEYTIYLLKKLGRKADKG